MQKKNSNCVSAGKKIAQQAWKIAGESCMNTCKKPQHWKLLEWFVPLFAFVVEILISIRPSASALIGVRRRQTGAGCSRWPEITNIDRGRGSQQFPTESGEERWLFSLLGGGSVQIAQKSRRYHQARVIPHSEEVIHLATGHTETSQRQVTLHTF